MKLARNATAGEYIGNWLISIELLVLIVYFLDGDRYGSITASGKILLCLIGFGVGADLVVSLFLFRFSFYAPFIAGFLVFVMYLSVPLSGGVKECLSFGGQGGMLALEVFILRSIEAPKRRKRPRRSAGTEVVRCTVIGLLFGILVCSAGEDLLDERIVADVQMTEDNEFDYDATVGYLREKAKGWQQLPIEERQEVVIAAMRLEYLELGNSSPVRVEFFQPEHVEGSGITIRDGGKYRTNDGVIEISKTELANDNIFHCLGIVSHEAFHAAQYEYVQLRTAMISSLSEQQQNNYFVRLASDYEYNFNHYTNGFRGMQEEEDLREHYEKYKSQILETHANLYAERRKTEWIVLLGLGADNTGYKG